MLQVITAAAAVSLVKIHIQTVIILGGSVIQHLALVPHLLTFQIDIQLSEAMIHDNLSAAVKNHHVEHKFHEKNEKMLCLESHSLLNVQSYGPLLGLKQLKSSWLQLIFFYQQPVTFL